MQARGAAPAPCPHISPVFVCTHFRVTVLHRSEGLWTALVLCLGKHVSVHTLDHTCVCVHILWDCLHFRGSEWMLKRMVLHFRGAPGL